MNNLEKEFVPYKEALEFKELGFDEPCFAFYQVENFEEKPCGVDDRDEYIRTGFATCKNSEIPEHFTSAPTYSQAFRWLREKYGLCGTINPFSYEVLDKNHEHCEWGCIEEVLCKTYEEAELACLRKLIEIVKQKQQ
jgi:hypothetical protein